MDLAAARHEDKDGLFLAAGCCIVWMASQGREVAAGEGGGGQVEEIFGGAALLADGKGLKGGIGLI